MNEFMKISKKDFAFYVLGQLEYLDKLDECAKSKNYEDKKINDLVSFFLVYLYHYLIAEDDNLDIVYQEFEDLFGKDSDEKVKLDLFIKRTEELHKRLLESL